MAVATSPWVIAWLSPEGHDWMVKAFGVVIEKWRERRGLSPQGLADLAGVARMTVPNMERGTCGPLFETVVRLARALRVSLERLSREARRVALRLRAAAR